MGIFSDSCGGGSSAYAETWPCEKFLRKASVGSSVCRGMAHQNEGNHEVGFPRAKAHGGVISWKRLFWPGSPARGDIA